MTHAQMINAAGQLGPDIHGHNAPRELSCTPVPNLKHLFHRPHPEQHTISNLDEWPGSSTEDLFPFMLQASAD